MKFRTRILLLLGLAVLLASRNALAQQSNETVSHERFPSQDPGSFEQGENARQKRNPLKTPIRNPRFDKTFWSIWIPAIATNVADAALTSACLTHPGCKEANPLLGGKPSNVTLWSLKAASVGLGLYVSRELRQDRSKLWLVPALALLVGGTAATINNSFVLLDVESRSSRSSSSRDIRLLKLSPASAQNNAFLVTKPNLIDSFAGSRIPSPRFSRFVQRGFALNLRF